MTNKNEWTEEKEKNYQKKVEQHRERIPQGAFTFETFNQTREENKRFWSILTPEERVRRNVMAEVIVID